MRRRGRTGLAAGLMTLLLAVTACSGQSDEDGPADDAAGDSTAAAETEADTAQARFDALLEEHRVLDVDPEDLPTPDEAYAAYLAESQADLSECFAEADTGEISCERPASLTEDLEDTINVQLLLDASGSMADPARGGTKMQVAQRVLRDFVATLPGSANVSLRVFGHVGTGSGADKARSCRSTEQRVPFVQADSPALRRGIDSVRPAGWTPLAGAMEAARTDLDRVGGEGTSNFVYVLSDGIETCDGDPVAAARSLAGAGIGVDVNIVGFDVDRAAARQLQQAARAAGGSYTDAGDARALADAFDSYDWAAWTRYYNCVVGQASSDYAAIAGVAVRNSSCLLGRIVREHSTILGRVTRETSERLAGTTRETTAMITALQRLRTDGEVDADEQREITDLINARREAFVARTSEIRDLVVELSTTRKDAIVDAATTRKEDVLAEALETRDRLIAEAEAARDAAAGDG